MVIDLEEPDTKSADQSRNTFLQKIRTHQKMGTHQACAFCEYQKRKCNKDCFLAPHFPAGRQEDFKNAHTLFGMSNMVKILKSIEPNRRDAASQTIIMEANMRKKDQVYGCVGIISKLIYKIEACSKELSFVNQQLINFRQKEEQLDRQQSLCVIDTKVQSSSPSLQLMQPFGSSNLPPPLSISLTNEGPNLEDMMNLDAGQNSLQVHESEADVKPTNQITNTIYQNMGTRKACAPCKYQRRKCHKDCFLAPYFPANRPENFKNAHRLFGVSNIVKILKSVEPDRRAVASETIIVEANLRKEERVHGCVGIISKLREKIKACSMELSLVNKQLVYFRQRKEAQQQQSQCFLTSRVPSSSSSWQLLQPCGTYNYQIPLSSSPPNDGLNLECMMNLDAGWTSLLLQEYEDVEDHDIKPADQIMNHQKMGTVILEDTGESSTESSLTEKPSPDHNVSDSEKKTNAGAFELPNVICKMAKEE